MSFLSSYLEPFEFNKSTMDTTPHISSVVVGLFIMVLTSGGLAFLAQRENKNGEKLWDIVDAGFGSWLVSCALSVGMYFIFKAAGVGVTTGAGLGIAVATSFVLSSGYP